MSLKFKKVVENFICEHCGREVNGNGFTNHCPFCLWSKHVDYNPGDRSSSCGGLMKPIKLENEKGEFIISHQCVTCNHIKRNKLSKEDDFTVALEAVRQGREQAS